MNRDYQYNVLGLGEVFLENNKVLLEKVTQMVIQEVDKSKKIVDEHIFEKENLPNELLKIFDRGTSHLSEINIYYIGDGLRQYLTNIEIF